MNSERSVKPIYDTPRLAVHGDMAQIVQLNAVCNFQDALGVPPAVVGSEYAPSVCNASD